MDLKITTRSVGGVTVVDCNGRLVLGDEASLLRDTIKGLLPQTSKIVLNMKNVGYIDSGGLGTLVGIYTSARNQGKDVKLAELTPKANNLLQVTKLLTVFDVHESEHSALRSFAQ